MSWLNLSNNLSNLSGNFSTITGQISNFTREVLTEGTEEAYDQETELKLAHIKIKDLESVLQKQKDEVERVSVLNEELHDRSVSAELQIQALSDEYRAVIEQKESEIKRLKSSQVDLRHGIIASQKDDSFARDGMEFEDPEFFQMTLNKLKKELDEVKKECRHWKEAAKSQDNQAELQQLKDHHQEEIASLQSTYSKRIAQMNKNHQAELEDLVNENESLLSEIKEYERKTASAGTNIEKPAASKVNDKVTEDKYKTLSLDYEIKRKQVENLQNQIVEEKRVRKIVEEEKLSLKEEVKRGNEKIIDLEGEVETLSANIGEREKIVSFDRSDKEQLEELDSMWRKKFDSLMQNLNEIRDENVAVSLELCQKEEKFSQLKTENDEIILKMESLRTEKEKLVAENEDLNDNIKELDELKSDILRLGNCTSDLLEELEFQKSLSEEQILEIESLRKICTIKGNPAEEIKKMQKSLKELGRRYVELYQHHQKVSLELRKSNERLRAEQQLRHASAFQLRNEISKVQKKLEQTVDQKLDSNRSESGRINSQLSSLDEQIDRRIQIVSELQLDADYVADEVAHAVSELGRKNNRDDTSRNVNSQSDTIEALVAEKSILERTIEGLERKVSSLEAQVAIQHEDTSTIDGTVSPSRTSDNSPRDSDVEPERKMRKIDFDSVDHGNADMKAAAKMLKPFAVADSTADGYFFDEEQPQDSKAWAPKEPEELSREQKMINKLEEKLLLKEKELNEINVIKNDLEFEKGTLEKVVMDLQKKLKLKLKVGEKESSFVDVYDQESETDLSSLDWDNLVEAKEDRKALIEELDRLKRDFQGVTNDISGMITFLKQRPEVRLDVPNVDDTNKGEKASEELGLLLHSYVNKASNEIFRRQETVNSLQATVHEREQELQHSAEEISRITTKFQDSATSLSRVRQQSLDIVRFLTDANNEKDGKSDVVEDEGQTCEDILTKVRLVVEDVVMENISETDADKWRMKLDKVLAEKDVLMQDLSDLRNQLRIWKEKHRDVVDENTSLLETVDLLRQDLELMSQGQTALTAEREQLQTELDKLQFQIDTNETDDSKEIGELKMQLDDLKIEKERIMRMVNDRDDFIVEQQEKHDSLVYQLVEEKDLDLQEIQGQLEQTMSLFKGKQEECAQLTARLASLEEENSLMNETNADMEKDLNNVLMKVEKLEREINDKTRKEIETKVMIKNLEEEDEELREKEMIEEDLMREQEILIQDLRNENEYLRDELNAKELLLQKKKRVEDAVGKTHPKEDVSKMWKEDNADSKSSSEKVAVENSKVVEDLRKENVDLAESNKELHNEIASCRASIETLERRIFEIEGKKSTRASPSIEQRFDRVNESDENKELSSSQDRELVALKENSTINVETRLNIEEPIVSETVSMMETESVNEEEKRLVEDYIKSQERVRELEVEVETYKRFEMVVDEKEIEVERLKSELARMMQVLRSKDELLLNLQMMEEQGSSDSPFSSRARVIQYIRDKETEVENVLEKCRTLEELAKHHSSQLELLKVERQNLVIFMRQKEEEVVDLNERLENVQARSVAKEHASNVLHSEHQKLMELNKSQGGEIARLRERNQYLQNVLQDKQHQTNIDRSISERNQELEIQIAAFQQEQERLLTLIHEKDNCNFDLRKKIELFESKDELVKKHPNMSEKVVEKDSQTLNGKYDRVEKTTSMQLENDRNDQMNSLCEDHHNCELKIDGLTEKLNKMSETNSKLLNDNDELKQKLDLYENEKSKIRTQMESESREKSIRIRELEMNLKELEKRIDEMTRNFELERSRFSHNFETRSLLMTQEWEEKMRLKDEKIKSLMEKIELLQSVQDHVDKSGTKNMGESEILKVENKKLRSLYEDKKNELLVLQGDIHKLKNISAARDAALNKMQNDNKYLIEEGNKKDSIIEDLQKTRTTCDQRIQELETEVHRLVIKCRETEAKAAKDMERLRNHLIEIEEGYTNEAVAAQEREQKLGKRLQELQDRYQTKSSEFKETSNQSNFQIQNLQQQLFAVASQRDNAVSRLAEVQERSRQTENALNNLQLVLERLQREKDSQYEMLEEESSKKLINASREIKDLKKKTESYQARIQEATLAVQGVANLTKDVEAKQNVISSLQREARALQEDLDAKTEMIKQLKDSTEGKIEKPLMKNLLMGYFHTPENKRPEVVRILGNLIGFSQDEINEVGSGAPPVQRTWVSSFMPFTATQKVPQRPVQRTNSNAAASLTKSFTEMFVSFLEEESSGANRRPTTNQLTALLMESPKSSSTPFSTRSDTGQKTEFFAPSMSVSNPLLVTPQDAKDLHNKAFKTSLPLLKTDISAASTPLFPAPGQEIPRVHTSTANSALRTMLAK
ncbi:thyroid receptor-interacting protein 11-like isoform X1 [Rhopilema esculentum]|uniref:thyroid receptor-interacting protein 11-like isoform X1 n=1 Tax=Rhopilema esculentum TaxID=499914 RepID=UPI0031E480BE